MLTIMPLLFHHHHHPRTTYHDSKSLFFSDKSSLKKENNRETGGTYSSNSCGSSSPDPSDPYDHCGSTSKCLSDDLLATEVQDNVVVHVISFPSSQKPSPPEKGLFVTQQNYQQGQCIVFQRVRSGPQAAVSRRAKPKKCLKKILSGRQALSCSKIDGDASTEWICQNSSQLELVV